MGSKCLQYKNTADLTKSSLQAWRDANPNNHDIPHADMDLALHMYSNMWPELDHSRHYCLNPLILAAELLEHAGVGCYPKVKRFKGDKGQRYNDTTMNIKGLGFTERRTTRCMCKHI